ncbi:hypothetical protein J19TS2_18510 [Cohnella xylanilytica]|uniref:acylneuraminate cytidylyltransferase family protein n=1 Tax=Cohnella xylanilytica TaxID=557555 RepID=UPI001B0DAC36|nr:acylneuraminate cytidylyltransferase family protein [Cohnella xylanilytica]GIO12296.1 hypothetical protein J19TS2_18510 [Cohnella xylanilytica]
MINGKKVLAVIPARGGSKGVPYKNIRLLAGKPLIAWTIDSARASKYIDRCIVSTDDLRIANVSRECGGEVPFMRPSEFAGDDTPGIDPVLHAIEQIPGYDIVVLLQPTSPLRTREDIDGCLERFIETRASFCVSVSEAEQSPYWMYTVNDEGRMESLLTGQTRYLTRQSLPTVYILNGAIYVAVPDVLKQKRSFLHPDTTAYVMPSERSLDIDTEMDFALAELTITTI